MKTLRFKLTASFLFITLIAFSVIGIFANLILEKQFEQYIISNLSKKTDEIVSTLKNRYTAWGDQWAISGIESIGMSALGDGLIVRVSDSHQTVLWDAMTHNSGMCAELLQRMAENMKNKNPAFNGGYTEKSYPITVNGADAGKVTIGYYGPYFYTDNDLSFLNTLNQLLLLAGTILAIVSIAFGTFTAKRLSKPISRVIRIAEQISEGNFRERITETANTKEIVDLTDTVNSLAEKLDRQEILRKQLTADVAHELRTPIANLQSHLEAMADGIWEPNAERLKSCHDEVVRLSGIVSALATLARYDSENASLDKENFDISELIQQVVSSFEKKIKDKRITLKSDVNKETVYADRDKLAQVLINILSNAVKYTPEDGTIKIEASSGDDCFAISVKDTGIGIEPDDLPYIFERFYRDDKSRNRATGGSGIGLAIAKALVEAHDGEISVSSKPGSGSEFIVMIPT